MKWLLILMAVFKVGGDKLSGETTSPAKKVS